LRRRRRPLRPRLGGEGRPHRRDRTGARDLLRTAARVHPHAPGRRARWGRPGARTAHARRRGMSATSVTSADLHGVFPGGRGRKPLQALHSVSLDIRPGETVGLVGESGSGKTTLGRAVLGLAPVSGGTISFDGRNISHLSRTERRGLARDIQVVFQDPYSSLNPSMTIEQILAEPLTANGVEGKRARARVQDLLDSVRLPADAAARLPREFSGGQRQRIAIARALALEPKLIVADEAVSALDLSTQARVLDLFVEIQESTGVAYLFVTHDLAV